VLLVGDRPEGVTFYGAFTDDAFARFMKALALVGSLATLLLSIDFMRSHKIGGFEFPVLLLLATLGMMMLISATDFIALYLGLELMSLALYVVAAYRRDDLRSSEAGLKYFVLGALSSGMLLYGISLMYGFAGTVSFAGVAAALTGPRRSAWCSAWSSCWRASRSRFPRCRSTCGRPTSMKARRRR
jgi:NADH-quinone oxidoreductase subunit N